MERGRLSFFPRVRNQVVGKETQNMRWREIVVLKKGFSVSGEEGDDVDFKEEGGRI